MKCQCCVREALYQGYNLLYRAARAGKRIEALKAGQGVKHIDDLRDHIRDGESMLLDEAANEDAQALAPPLIAPAYHLLKVGVEDGEGAQAAQRCPIGLPEAGKDRDILIQCLACLRTLKSSRQMFQPPPRGQEVVERLQ